MLSWKYSQIFLRIHIIVNIGEKLSWTMPPDVYLFPCCPRREEVLNVTTQKRKSVLFVDNWGIRYRKQHKHWKVHTYSWHVMNWWCCLIVEQPTLSSCPECVTFSSYATEETYWKLSYRGNILKLWYLHMNSPWPALQHDSIGKLWIQTSFILFQFLGRHCTMFSRGTCYYVHWIPMFAHFVRHSILSDLSG